MLDIRLKSSHRKRSLLGAAAVLAAAVLSLFLFPLIGEQAEQEYGRRMEEREYENSVGLSGIDFDLMNTLRKGSYVLFYEMAGFDGNHQEAVEAVMEEWTAEFESYRNELDYLAQTTDKMETNTTREIGKLLPGGSGSEELKKQYQCYFTLKYDENGELSIENVWGSYEFGIEDAIVKTLLRTNRQNSFQEWENVQLRHEAEEKGEEWEEGTAGSGFMPKNFQMVFGIPKSMEIASYGYLNSNYWYRVWLYGTNGSYLLYGGTMAALLVILLLLTSNRIWSGTVDYRRRGRWYLAEAAVAGVVLVLIAWDGFAELNVQYNSMFLGRTPIEIIRNGSLELIMNLLEMAVVLLSLFGGWYLSLAFLRPLFALGLRGYLREYSLVCCICTKGVSWLSRCWERTKYEVSHVDFSNRTIRTIRKLVVLNFLILAFLSFFWFFGIFALLIYSAALFFLLKNQYHKVERDYQSLMRATTRIAGGDLQYEDQRDWGLFEPLKAELAKIRQGFSKAVEKEVKSERMKTELITNVSHDLKTPLTAITTYVELLKDESITQEQRMSYVEVLERKALRLKVLVEDLFEVSKAASNSIQLDLMEVDVVNLLKQVCVEHEKAFTDMGLELKWKIPEEKTTRLLDNQKTWRIFENLFLNIEKYAMPGSRVFIQVGKQREEGPGLEKEERQKDGALSVVIKNMSAQELNVSGAEITERFVRGDASRTTEGSGLGLAIAKSFVEAQGGEFTVTVDGDLFKAEIVWK